MLTRIHTKRETKNWYSKYHFIKDHIVETTYELIQNKVLSKFHRTTQIKKYEVVLPELILGDSCDNSPSRHLDENATKSSCPSTPLMDGIKTNINKKRLDWTRGRFTGKVERIIIEGGIIVSKTFLTPKGVMITVKRSELGLLANWFSS